MNGHPGCSIQHHSWYSADAQSLIASIGFLMGYDNLGLVMGKMEKKSDEGTNM